MKLTMTLQKLFTSIIFILGLTPFAFWIITQYNQDAWWDELISLKNYGLVDFVTTTTTYPDPNNHILFNLINNLFTRIMGMRDFYEILDHIYVLRILQAVFAFVTILYSFLIVRRFFSQKHAALTVVMLTSTIPFLNFSLQLRGYGLSMMFFVMILYHAWGYIDSKKKMHLILIPLLVFSLLYTIPSNIYPLLALSITILLTWRKKRNEYKKERLASIKQKKNNKQVPVSTFKQIDKSYLLLLTFSLIGLLFCFLAYLPVMENLLNNRFVLKVSENRHHVLSVLLPIILKSFMSARWLLLLFAPILLISWIKGKRPRWNLDKNRFRHLILIFILPFVFLFLHNKMPFERTLIVLVPIFAIILSVLIIELIERMKLKNVNYNYVLIAIIAIYTVSTSFIQMNENDRVLNQNIASEKREQNIYRNYYQCSSFKPHAAAKVISRMKDIKIPVLVMDELDRVSSTYYLEKYNLKSFTVIKIQPRTVQIEGKKFNHAALIQQSHGKNEALTFLNLPCNLQYKEKLNPYILLLEYTNSLAPNKKGVLMTSYPSVIKELEKKMTKYHINEYSTNGYRIFEFQKKLQQSLNN